ncbi:hypothetical protein QOZ80_1BG0078230 [Eleusine coracana subsp. coracana]|nr:hypothetical protein QOZ80_1BG0078230 [Eleusine coracana subsp. coracana]
MQRFILLDMTGCKVEAVARGSTVSCFNDVLKEGCTYTMHRVIFKRISDDGKFRNIGNTYECSFVENTMAVPFTLPIQFPPYPKHLMPFSQVFRRPDKTFVDIARIIVHWGELEHIGTYPNQRHYREIILMDDRSNMLTVGIWSEHLRQHAISLPTAAVDKQIIIGTMLKNNYKHGCFETSSYTKFAFKPIHHATSELQGF